MCNTGCEISWRHVKLLNLPGMNIRVHDLRKESKKIRKILNVHTRSQAEMSIRRCRCECELIGTSSSRTSDTRCSDWWIASDDDDALLYM